MRSLTESTSSGRKLQGQTGVTTKTNRSEKSGDPERVKVKKKEKREALVQSSSKTYETAGVPVIKDRKEKTLPGSDEKQSRRHANRDDAEIDARAERKATRRAKASSMPDALQNRKAIEEMMAMETAGASAFMQTRALPQPYLSSSVNPAHIAEVRHMDQAHAPTLDAPASTESTLLSSPRRTTGPARRRMTDAAQALRTSAPATTTPTPAASNATAQPVSPRSRELPAIPETTAATHSRPAGGVRLPLLPSSTQLRPVLRPSLTEVPTGQVPSQVRPFPALRPVALRSKSSQDLPGQPDPDALKDLRHSNPATPRATDAELADNAPTQTSLPERSEPQSPRARPMESMEEYNARMNLFLREGDRKLAESYGRNDAEQRQDGELTGNKTPRAEREGTAGSAKSSPPALPAMPQQPSVSLQANPVSPRGLPRRERTERDYRCLQLLGKINQNSLPALTSPDLNVELKKRVKPLTAEEKSVLVASAVTALTDDGMFDQGEQGFLLRAVLIRSAHFAALDLADLLAN